MPSLEQNLAKWSQHGWPMGGDEWSTLGGGSLNWWYGLILPRLAPSLRSVNGTDKDTLHCQTILEIAPGHGRWTQYLLAHCDRLIGIDLVPECAACCEHMFASHATACEFYSNDGKSLSLADDASVDCVFSWDSLVHAEIDVIDAYVRECSRVLVPGGRAFLHHSNLAEYKDAAGVVQAERTHWRASSVSATMVDALCAELGITCVCQELITKGQREDDGICIDCITVIQNAQPKPGQHVRIRRNGSFWREIQAMGRVRATYDPIGDPMNDPTKPAAQTQR